MNCAFPNCNETRVHSFHYYELGDPIMRTDADGRPDTINQGELIALAELIEKGRSEESVPKSRLPKQVCQGCNADIAWIRTERGRSMPVNLPAVSILTEEGKVVRGYTSHFATCPKAKEFRKEKKDAGDTNSGKAPDHVLSEIERP